MVSPSLSLLCSLDTIPTFSGFGYWGKKEATKNGDKTKCEEKRDGPALHFQLRLMLTGRWWGEMTYTWEMGTFAMF